MAADRHRMQNPLSRSNSNGVILSTSCFLPHSIQMKYALFLNGVGATPLL